MKRMFTKTFLIERFSTIIRISVKIVIYVYKCFVVKIKILFRNLFFFNTFITCYHDIIDAIL